MLRVGEVKLIEVGAPAVPVQEALPATKTSSGGRVSLSSASKASAFDAPVCAILTVNVTVSPASPLLIEPVLTTLS